MHRALGTKDVSDLYALSTAKAKPLYASLAFRLPAGVEQLDVRGETAAHVAAGLGQAQRLKALICDKRAAQVRDLLETRDVWGATPLYRALDLPYASPCLPLLLGQDGVRPLPGPLGMTMPMCAGIHRRPALAATLTQLGGPQRLASFGESGWRSLLAHLFGVGGETCLHGVRLSLDGGWTVPEHLLLGRAMHALCETPPASLLGVPVQAWAQAFSQVAVNLGAPTELLLQSIRSGTPVVLPTTVRGGRHVVDYAWYRGHFAECDRAARGFVRRHPACRLLRSNAAALRLQDLESLQKSLYCADVSSRRTHKAIRAQVAHASPLRGFFKRESMRRQRVNNCSTASAKAALFFFVAVDAEHHGKTGQARDVYKTITTFVRYYFLRGYLQRHVHGSDEPFDATLLSTCWDKLHKKTRSQFLEESWARNLQVLARQRRFGL